MSSFTLFRFFCLAEGRWVMMTRANNTHIWHAHYTTSVQCADGTSLPANICIYSPMNDIVHTENMITFIYAQAYITNDSTVLMDASHIIPCPGNPDEDCYQDSVPNLPNPFVIALGHVSGRAGHLPDGSCTFPVAVSKYVRDNTQLSNIRSPHVHFLCVFLLTLFVKWYF
jgi:hypothetical protein